MTSLASPAGGSGPHGPDLDRVPHAPVPAVLALGANLGEAAATLAAAVRQLAETPGIELTGVSPVAITQPVGGPPGQPEYLNLVVTLTTRLSPRALLAAGQQIESTHHRTREVRWGPRTLDIDVITYADLTSEDPELILPHPRAHLRAFVLTPWSWVDPEATLGGARVADLAAQADDAGSVRRLPTGTGGPAS
ncbi:2-amino-4-hydroxy-6-hydroxymethyldihydropteridine diphosphokinase [Citricoccus sp.]|uniref:2-amino-4-hydroxy-6- hydroxymethyldihydropteridine diphosphokinase n=1 Tax=Citricoccus sp. TaxID=1978372 RepID=UPI0028BDA3E3|nr:2-amino-4-hydroxy-6-hydroxymethyldihydropteridine diphosphokinase [Citricoccus sp.]